MTSSQRVSLLVVALLLFTGVAAGARWLLRSRPVAAVEAPASGAPAALGDAPGEPARVEAVRPEPDAGPAPTPVVFPLEVELELVSPGRLRPPEGVPARGSAATARITGGVWDAGNQGVEADVRFVHGANEGRELHCDPSGAFGASDLWPGLSIVEIQGPGIVGAQREVLLRQERETVLNVSFARPARVTGEVIDRSGAPIEGARVTMDGQTAFTDSAGVFQYPQMASGTVVVVVEKQGYRSYRELLPVTLDATIELGRLRYALDPGASLEITIPERIGGAEEAYVIFIPPQGGVQRDYPWFLINPTRVWPGGRVQIDDLPSGRIDLRLFHSGAVARPELAVANLSPGEVRRVEIHLEPAPMLTGTVRMGGRPVAEATVTLEAADRLGATLAAVGEDYGFIESAVLPTLPPAAQTVRTDAHGEYVLSSWESASRYRYLTAVGPDGASFAGQLLKGGEQTVDLTLAPAEEQSGRLRLVMEGRFQPLPVVTRVRGVPGGKRVLPPDQDLVIDGLPTGTWSLSLRWNTDRLLDHEALEIEDKHATELEVTLPEGAIQGQTEEIRLRAGAR
jgi:Carboxypeptidase regulatory-like domain